MTDNDRAWLRSLPLLLSAGVLMIAGAFAFFKADDQIASVAAFTAGLMLLGSWVATAIIDWHQNLHRKRGE